MEASIENLLADLPDAGSASRFLARFSEEHPGKAKKLMRSPGLLSDALTLVSFSPLLATTLQQNPEYISWLGTRRADTSIRTKEELLESLAQFALMHSQIETQVLLARFRRRELLRIFLRDIRRLATIAEITEEISNLADAVLEFALRTARQELDNRCGNPLETDEKGRSRPADVCIVALGKLGSKELNYSSDIDLVFMYSAEGKTSGHGSRGPVTNREYFIKLAEHITKLIGEKTGEGAAYRVDMRLRPHGRIGALALSLADSVRYYRTEARSWERQVLIRSRASAGDAMIFKEFFAQVEDQVFAPDESVERALANVRSSKQKIDLEQITSKGLDVKLGKGGIREIEFIAQALQLAYGGRDRWLRAPHTLISLARLSDRGLLSESELTELFDAYDFLRHLEHLLQMENGLQTHQLPNDPERRELFARRMRFKGLGEFEESLRGHTENVSRVYHRIFEEAAAHVPSGSAPEMPDNTAADARLRRRRRSTGLPPHLQSSLEKAGIEIDERDLKALKRLASVSPHFAEMVSANPLLAEGLAVPSGPPVRDYGSEIASAVDSEKMFAGRLAALRKAWSRLLIEIVVADVFEKVDLRQVKKLQTRLAEASIDAAFRIARAELGHRYRVPIGEFPQAILGLGKIGGGGIDYDSDLDLVMVHDENFPLPVSGVTHSEFFSRAVEIFVSAVSGITRDGKLYRVDLRLRPHGKNGPSTISRAAFAEYMRSEAAIWELLAFVKLRAVDGDLERAMSIEHEIRSIIHERALAIGKDELRDETRRVRLRLEEERSRGRKGRDIDIKYGSGGMLDVYFAMRYLQLRDNVPDDPEDRSSGFMLRKLHDAGSLSGEMLHVLLSGYEFMSHLDHNLRLVVSRTTRLPVANVPALEIVARRMHLASVNELLEKLTLHRLQIRDAFEHILD